MFHPPSYSDIQEERTIFFTFSLWLNKPNHHRQLVTILHPLLALSEKGQTFRGLVLSKLTKSITSAKTLCCSWIICLGCQCFLLHNTGHLCTFDESPQSTCLSQRPLLLLALLVSRYVIWIMTADGIPIGYYSEHSHLVL